MDHLFTINACKTFGCRNLGLANSADYHYPDYRLGYPALCCEACGSYPPLFNDAEFGFWLSAYLTAYAHDRGLFCPVCYQRDIIRYGYNPRGTQRLQCHCCEKVWTPKHQALSPIKPPEQICSTPLVVPFQGNHAGENLYILLSFDARRGNVLHLSSNFTPHPVGTSLHYRWRGIKEPHDVGGDIANRITMKENIFLRRSQFDEIQYGSALSKRNCRGAMLRPVIAAHGHFKLLSHLFPEVKTHIIAHECFLRGAVITAWARQFRQQQSELWYVEEEITSDDGVEPWQLQGKTWHGWWQNQWQLWQQGENRKMVCSLAHSRGEKQTIPALTASRRFTKWLEKRPEFTQSALFSAGRVTQILASLAQEYNAALTAAAPDD